MSLVVLWPAIDVNTIIQQVDGMYQIRQIVTADTQTDINDSGELIVEKKHQDCAEIIL